MHRMTTMGMRAAYTLLIPVLSLMAVEPPPGISVPRPRPILENGQAAPATRTMGGASTSARPARPEAPAAGPATAGKPGGGAKTPPPAKAPASDETATPADGTASGSTIDHDTVILTNEQRFQGTVLANQDTPDQVAINTGSGVLVISRNRVARVEYGLTARMGKVKKDDLAGLVDLAHWCRSNRRNAEALQLLVKAVALPGCDIKTRGLYAQLVDEIEGAEHALPLYVAYRNGGGDDAEILARLSELEKARQAWEEQMRALGLDPGASSESGAPVAAATASQVEEGYEKYTWVGDNPKFANPVTISQTVLATPDGPRKVLQVDYQPNPDNAGVDKAAVVLRRQVQLDLTKKMTFLAANRSAKDVRIAIAVKTGTDWTYYESPTQSLPSTSSGQEFVSLSFDLGASTFKSAASQWAHSGRIEHPEMVRELQILIHNGRNEGSLWLAGIAFSGD